MDKFEYQPATFGASTVNMDGDGGYVGTAENVRSRFWARELGKDNLMSAVRLARECEVDFACDYATADRLREAADADLLALTPGTFVAQGEWRQRGYIVESNVKGVHFGWLNASLVLALLDGAWWRVRGESFLPEQDTSGETRYQSDTGKSVRTDGAAAEDLHGLTVYGESVQIGTPTPEAPIPISVVEPYTWNQLYAQSAGTKTANGVTIKRYADGSIEYSGTVEEGSSNYTDVYSNTAMLSSIVAGHKYLIRVSDTNKSSQFSGDGTSRYLFIVTNNAYQEVNGGYSFIKTFTAAPTYFVLRFRLSQHIGQYVSGSGYINVIDLTLIYGAGNEPSTVAEFDARFPETNYAYDAGTSTFALNCGGTSTPINLNGNFLASLPDGTKDVLTVDSGGNAAIAKRVAHTTQAVTDGVTGTVGVDVLSSTGEITDGADVYYKAAESTVNLTAITMPDTADGGTVEVLAAVTPTITAEWQLKNSANLDFPHDYSYDYAQPTTGAAIDTGRIVPCKPLIVFYGAVTNPEITIAGNKYKVTKSVPAGARIEIDGRDHTVKMITSGGTVTDEFANALRGSGEGGGEYIFQPIPPGEHSITWDGTFGVDVNWYDEVGEPPWSLS